MPGDAGRRPGMPDGPASDEAAPAWSLLDELRSRSGVAVVDGVGPMQWPELAERVAALVAHWRAEGFPARSSIALLSPNRREVIEVELACLVGGWDCVPVNWHFDAPGLERLLDEVRAVTLVADPVLLGLVDAALARRADRGVAPLPVLVLDGGEHLAGGDEFGGGAARHADYEQVLSRAGTTGPAPGAPGEIVFSTSGTTGRSRSVRFIGPPGELDHPVGAALRHHLPSLVSVGIPDAGRTLLCGPHYHWAQWTFGVLPIVRGSTIVIQPRFVPTWALASIDEQAITNLMLLPTQFVRLLRLEPSVRSRFDGSSLQSVVHGAAPCSPEAKRAMLDWWGPVITEYFGATESGVVSLATSADWADRPESVGRVVPGKEVTVVTDDGEVGAIGRDGIIHVRSLAGLGMEYIGAPAATTATRALPGHVTFGDMGRLDGDGYLHLSDRRSDMIVTGGMNVPSAEVEAVVSMHPAVADVAVYGVPDSTAGQVVRAAIELTPGSLDPSDTVAVTSLFEELLGFCQERLPSHRCPVAVEIVEQLPRNAAGKMVKRRLRAPYWEPHIGPITIRQL